MDFLNDDKNAHGDIDKWDNKFIAIDFIGYGN